MKLQQAFELSRGDVVAFIGAGGKTSALIGIGYELAEAGWRVLATTTTAIKEEQLQLMPATRHYAADSFYISEALSQHGFVFLHDAIRDGQVYGATMDRIREILDTVDSDILLVEADGAQGLPLKAPFDGEPLIPDAATLVIPIASLGALGKPLDEAHIYNPQAMIEKYGFYAGSEVRSPWIAQVLRDEELGLRGIPEKARVIAFLNQTPSDGYLRDRARLIAKLVLKSPRLQGVALGSVRASNPICEVQRPIGAIILADNKLCGLEQPEMLQPWTKSKTVIEHIVERLIRSRLEQIVVVAGYYADEIKRLLKPLGIKVMYNRAYKTGNLLGSFKVGLRAMPEHIAASLVVFGHQSQIQPRVLYQLMMAYAEGKGELVVPRYQMRQGYPVLIGRRYWPDLMKQRQVISFSEAINRYSGEMTYLDVDTESVLQAQDTLPDKIP